MMKPKIDIPVKTLQCFFVTVVLFFYINPVAVGILKELSYQLHIFLQMTKILRIDIFKSLDSSQLSHRKETKYQVHPR